MIAGTHGPQRATMKLDVDGQIKIEEAEGNGPVDAVFNCIKALVPHEAKLELYQVHAVTEGTDAQAEVSVRLAHEGRSMTSQGRRPGYAGGLGQGLSRRAQQDRHEAPARHAGGGGELITPTPSLRAKRSNPEPQRKTGLLRRYRSSQ